MILKRYGTTYQSVELNFDSKALNEIGFRRDRKRSLDAEEFERRFTLIERHELEAEADGSVQDHTEQELLDRLEGKIRDIQSGLPEGQVLVFENGDGTDYPKTRQRTENVIERGENKLHFLYSVAPAVRVGVYGPRA